jgi:hypothetical protein
MLPTEMRVLLLSMVIYLLGVAVLLYIRPRLMFRSDGSWKEFGVGNEDTSVFPVWMFCIVWAVVSYGLGRLIFKDDDLQLTNAAATGSTTPMVEQQVSGATMPGYYKLDTAVIRKKGVPRYIYVGASAPADIGASAPADLDESA